MVWKVFQDGFHAWITQIVEVPMYRVLTKATGTFQVGFRIELAFVIRFSRKVFYFANGFRSQWRGFEQAISGVVGCHGSNSPSHF